VLYNAKEGRKDGRTIPILRKKKGKKKRVRYEKRSVDETL